jgi:putative ABC transport system substrate-binding protein
MVPFRQGLNETGFVEGQNVAVEYRWADGKYDRLPALAADLIGRRVSVICAALLPAALAAKDATTTIPIVFVIGSDPTQSGLVTNLARPGGNITGVSGYGTPLVAKRLELLREVAPTATVIGMLVNPNNPNAKVQLRDARTAAARFGVQLVVLTASADGDLDTVPEMLVKQRVSALLTGVDSFLTSRRDQIVELARRHRVPAIYQNRDFVLAGGLMSYHATFTDAYRVMGSYTGRILNGEKPADLAVQEAKKIELMINLKTAKALGITVPPTLLARADEVIE